MPDRLLSRTLVVLVLVLLSPLASAGSWGVNDLMQLLAQQKSGRATFTEKKTLSILDRPLESSGELAFTAPDRLEKRTLKPKPETLLLEGDRLTIDQAEKRRISLSLQDHPEVSAFVDSIRATLAGDRAALEKFYTVELSGSADKWQLVLVPSQSRMLAVISRIRIAGAQATVRTIEFEQADGDRSEMTITSVAK
ncbi:outer membrane lipoprotein carrier protein LolA [Rhodocyclus tenuis]|uniref:Outer membrane lipoprotein-sorting protein n=1 Tax=Rhodocyclus tenuis TaxID=1066 RepID=A0A840FUQ3_RHOTE|nr:outer membrane lipoprotein carrier protein LolA [Rhodocyclus tenuis]MBB4245817.1 outer membrane lipoprotein-sorting protein [Rhodocyclus tenuis]